MARFEIVHAYRLRLPEPDATKLADWETALDWWVTGFHDDPPRAEWRWEHADSGERAVRLSVATDTRDGWHGPSTVRELAERLTAAQARTHDRWPLTERASELAAALVHAVAHELVRIPLRTHDAHSIVTNDQALTAVEACVREHWRFLPDAAATQRGLQAFREGETLVISGTAPTAADAATAYLSAPARVVAQATARTRQPVWAWASALVALITVALSPLPLTAVSLAVLGTLATAAAGGAIVAAPRWNARRWATLAGVMPALLLVLFACAYGIATLASDAVQLPGAAADHLREPLLLSLSLLTTVGVLDLQLDGWVRSLAYLEMLLVASIAGGAAIVAVRRVSGRVEEIIGAVRADRG